MTATSSSTFEDLFDPEEYLYFLEETLAEENTPKQCDFIEQVLDLAPGSRVLDMGCGHGRHVIELASRGHQVIGIDLVAGFLEIAAKEAEKRGVKVSLGQGDIRTVGIEGGLDGIICLFDAFGFFPDDDNAQVLYNAFQSLSPGKSLLLDVRPREVLLRLPTVSVLDKGNGDMMVDRHHFDVESGRLVDRRSYVRNGKAREISFSVRLYSYTELRLILRSIGFEVTGAYSGYDGAPLTVHATRMLIRARKP